MARRSAGQRAAGPDAGTEGLMDSQSCCVLVTGFGPFRQHLVNSSWEAVKELSKLGLGMDMDLKLRTQQLPVDYREVKRRLTRIWEDFQPQFAVHVGVDTSTKAIFLEQCGKNRGYRDTDIRGFRPEDGTCLPGGPEVMRSVVSMKKVCRHIAVEDVDVAFSGDAGRYICDYAYYLSLHLGNGRAALIHIPPLSRWFSASLLGKALQVIIQKILEDSKVLAPSMETPSKGKQGVASLEEIKCFNPGAESSSVL